MAMVEVIGEVDRITYDSRAETVTLDGEYGLYQFEADADARDGLREVLDAIEEVQDGDE